MTNNDVIDTLQQAGFRVRVQHFRYYHLNRTGQLTKRAHLLPTQAPRAQQGRKLELMEPNGGATKCLILASTNAKNVGRFAEGTSRCDPLDPFNRSQGVRFALRDALLNLLASVPANEGNLLMLLNHAIEQLEQVENEYQEDVRLRATSAEVRQAQDIHRWGNVRAASHNKRKANMSREQRVAFIRPIAEQVMSGMESAIEVHAY